MFTLQGSVLSLEDLAIYVTLVCSHVSIAVISTLMGNRLAKGANPLIFVVYTHAFGGLFLSPIAFFFKKKTSSPKWIYLCWLGWLCSLGGKCAFQTLLLMGLKGTSASFSSAMPNLSPTLVFLMAWAFG